MSLLDTIAEVGSAAASTLGTIGGGAAAYVFKRFAAAEKVARDARRTALAAQKEVEELREEIAEKLRAFRVEIEQRINTTAAPPHGSGAEFVVIPDTAQIARFDRELADLRKACEALRESIGRERDRRHRLQERIAEEARKDAEQWQTINRELGRLSGMMDRDRR